MKKLFFILSFLVFIPTARAQMDCEEVPSCAELGYTQDSCAGGKGVRCPFDENKFYCAGVKQLPDAENPGVTDENWSAGCADKIAYCTAYNNDCQCTACESGYLLSDGACVPECDKSVDICAAESKIFNADTCTCEACPENYQFNSETKSCEQIACDKTKVEHCTTYSSDYEPCTCQACETNYLLVDGVCVLQCSGANQCLYQGSCVTCYKSCPVYWRYYLDEEPDGAVCSLIRSIYKGSGNGAEATYEPCYDDCVTCEKACEIFTGLDNTTDAVAQLGNKGLAVYAATQFYVGSKNGAFGQGQWYLPAIGEWMVFYGTDISKSLPVLDFSVGAIGDNMALIKNALNILKNKGVEAEPLSGYYWSSTSLGSSNVATLNASDGRRLSKCSYYGCSSSRGTSYVRCSLFLTLTTNGTAPAIGDVVYLDKTYGAASDYDGSKTPVGIIASVSGNDVKIINLKNLTFSSKNTVGNFDPNNPYSGITEQTAFLPENSSSMYLHDITGNFCNRSSDNAISVMNKYSCTCPFKPGACTLSAAICAAESKAFNSGTCACEDCPSGYLFDSEVNECREACREDITNCVEYDSEWADCKCTACKEYGYLRRYFYLSYVVSSRGTCVEDFCSVCRNCSGGCSVAYCRKCDSTQMGVCDQCADGFTLENNKCIPPTGRCIEGSTLYDDFNCYDPENAPADRTVIGIVYAARPKSVDVADPNNLYAISLSYTVLPWSENLANTETGCNSETDGQANTDCIIAAGAEENSAAVYCSKYGVTDADKGKWFLPAVNQIENEQSFMCLISNGISAITGTSNPKIGLPALTLGSGYASIATSSEYKYDPVLGNTIIRPSGGWAYERKSQTKQTVYCIIDFKKYQ